MKTLLITAALFLVSSTVQAAELRTSDFRNGGSTNKRNLLEAVALNAAAGSRTITLDTEGFESLRVFVEFTYAAATTVVLTPTCSYDGTLYGSYTSRSISSGASTVSLFVDTYTTGAANANLVYEYSVAGCKKTRIIFSGASAGGSDLVDVQAVASIVE